jgi:hypothetical protein
MDQSAFLPDALTLAQRAFAKAESLAFTEGLILRFLTAPLTADLAPALPRLTLAQRLLWAAAILARAAGLILDLFAGAATPSVDGTDEPPRRERSSVSRATISSLTAAARFRFVDDIDNRIFMMEPV